MCAKEFIFQLFTRDEKWQIDNFEKQLHLNRKKGLAETHTNCCVLKCSVFSIV